MLQWRAMRLHSWDHITEEPMNPLLSRQVIHGDKMTLARIDLRKGAVVAMHAHENEQLSIVESGRLLYEVDGEEAAAQSGDMILIPSGAPHTVEALEDCIVLDIFAPAREDWRRGDDAYLRR